MIVNGERELVYTVKIDDIKPIEGADRVELAYIGGWHVMVKKGQFKVGDIAIYFEIDSKVPAVEPFLFLEKNKYVIKTQKYFKGTVLSQGLLMPLQDFNMNINVEGVPLTKSLKVTHVDYAPEKPQNTIDNIKSHKGLMKNPLVKTLMRYYLGRKILGIIFSKSKKIDKKFPTHLPFVTRTDQPRCENIPQVCGDGNAYIVTEKCDGSSGTYILERIRKNKYEFYVCSRNIRQLKEDSPCFYDENFYWQAAKKYNIKEKMTHYMDKHPELKYLCWQGEVCHPKIQGNPHGLTGLHLFMFHMITSDIGKWNILQAKQIWDSYELESVPIVDTFYRIPNDFDDFKATADGYYNPSCCEGKTTQLREGYVYYRADDPNFSFKNVSNNYLLSHSGGSN